VCADWSRTISSATEECPVALLPLPGKDHHLPRPGCGRLKCKAGREAGGRGCCSGGDHPFAHNEL